MRDRPMPVRAIAFDTAIAVAFAAIAFFEAATHADDGFTTTGPALLGGVAAGIAPVPLALRRVRPLTSAAAVAALGSLPHLLLTYDVVSVGGLVPLIIAAEGAARYGRRTWNRLALLFPVPGLVVMSITVHGFVGQVAVYAAAIGIGWTVGVLVRALVEQRGSLAREVAALHEARELRLEAAVRAERARIARDLHDVIAHHVSVMVLQSGGARLRMRVDPAGSAIAIAQVEATGHEALVELRRVLGVLRGEPDDEPDRSVARLDRLADQLGSAGLDVSLRLEGDVSSIPAGLDRSLYRVAQECLTNALKHGSDASADVRLGGPR